MKRLFVLISIMFILLGCVDNSIKNKIELDAKNDYYRAEYDIDETNLKLYSIDFDSLLNYEEVIDRDKYIMLFIRRSCEFSKDLLIDFVKEYNSGNYSFEEIYIFEVDDYVSDDEKQTDINREKFQKKFDINTVPVTLLVNEKKIFVTEVGYYPTEVLKEVLEEFEER